MSNNNGPISEYRDKRYWTGTRKTLRVFAYANCTKRGVEWAIQAIQPTNNYQFDVKYAIQESMNH